MNEPPKPGDVIVVLYRDGEVEYGMVAVRTCVVEPSPLASPLSATSFVWFRAGGARLLTRQLDEEGIEWARDPGPPPGHDSDWSWHTLVQTLQAARRLAGTGDT